MDIRILLILAHLQCWTVPNRYVTSLTPAASSPEKNENELTGNSSKK